LVNVTTYDAHTKQKIDFKDKLKEEKVNKGQYLGKEFDSKVKTYGNKNKITSFETIQERDRKKFKVKFLKDVDTFDLYVEGSHSVVFVGDKYGYQGHFIIDNEYWYDLENKQGSRNCINYKK